MNEKFDISELYEKERIDKKKFDYIRFTTTDINGIGRTLVVPRRYVEDAVKGGVSLFAGIVSLDPRTNLAFTKEVMDLHLPNCALKPCPGTLHDIPWNGDRKISFGSSEENTKRKIGEILCETFWIPPFRNGSQMEAGSRYVLRKQLEKLNKIGLVFKSAFEAEFSVFHRDTNKPIFEGMDASTTLRLSEFEDFLYTLEENFQKAGIDTSSIVVEHGEGQFEFGMEPVYGVKGADNMFLIKQSVKEMCLKLGYIATFMAKPFKNSSTNGQHLNMSLWRKLPNGELVNAFYDSSDKNGLSALHRHWIAGLLKHGKALCAFSCPTTNCYRRMHNFLTPSKIEWGLDDRLTACRAKSMSPSGTYVENRLPSSASNPYLVTACTIAAGLDGVLNKLPLCEPRKETVNLDLVHEQLPYTPDTESDKYFPFTLKEAIAELEKDEVIKEAMGEELVRWFVQVKDQWDINVFEPLDDESRWKKEFELFYEFL